MIRSIANRVFTKTIFYLSEDKRTNIHLTMKTILTFITSSRQTLLLWVIVFLITFSSLSYIVSIQSPPLNNLVKIETTTARLPQNIPYKGNIQLIDVSLEWGLNFIHQQKSNEISTVSDTLGSGVCAIDYNNDGWTDLYFVGGSGNTRYYGRSSWWNTSTFGKLFKNHEGKYLEDVTKKVGLDFISEGMGCAVHDINKDGFSDILITSIHSNHLFKNNKGDSFSDVTGISNISTSGWSTGAVFGDFNKDGLPDLYIPKFIKFKKDSKTLESNSGFQAFKSVAFNPQFYDPEPNQLFLNQGNFSFKNVTEKFNVGNKSGRSLGAYWVDLNKDSWIDLLVINMPPTPNEVYINNKGLELLIADETYDSLRGTGNHSLIATSLIQNSTREFFSTSNSQFPLELLKQKNITNTINEYLFKNVSYFFNLNSSKLSSLNHWGAVSGDFNNDKYQDIFTANGNLFADQDSPFLPSGQPNTLLINNFGKQFSTIKVSEPINGSSRSTITADLNNDGQLEIIITNNNGAAQILEPTLITKDSTPNNWIGFILRNTASLKGEPGTIKIKTGEIIQSRSLLPSSNYLSQSSNHLHFGLGKNTNINTVSINTSKHSFTVKNLSSGHYYLVDLHTNKIKKLPNSKFEYPIKKLAKSLSINSLDYLIQILLKNNNSEYIKVIPLIWEKMESVQKLSTLKSLKNIKNILELNLALTALQDKDSKVVIAAIRILKKSEIEQIMPHLIKQLYNKNTDIQCAITNTISFFFKEEEAMVYQKNLSIKPLIKGLEKGTIKQKICIIKALGDSENSRAVSPLLNIILPNSEEEASLIIAAIDALSEIRDSRSIEPIIAISKSIKTTPPEIRAAALIALSRMKEKHINDIINKLIFSKLSSDNKNKQIEAISLLENIYKHKNYFLIQPFIYKESIKPIIKDIIHSLSIEIKSNLNREEKSLIVSLINISMVTKDSESIDSLLHIIKQKNNKSNNKVITKLLNISSPSTKVSSTLNTISNDKSIKHLIFLLNSDKLHDKGKIKLINLIIRKMVKTNITRDEVNYFFTLLNKNNSSALLNKILLTRSLVLYNKTLFTICSKTQSSIQVSVIDKILINKINHPKEFLECVYNKNSSHTSLSKSNRLQLRTLLIKLINKKDENLKLKGMLFVNAMLHDKIITTMLKQYIQYISKEHINLALNAIEKHGLEKIFNTFIWDTAKNTNNPDSLRMHAILLANKLSSIQAYNYLKTYNAQ